MPTKVVVLRTAHRKDTVAVPVAPPPGRARNQAAVAIHAPTRRGLELGVVDDHAAPFAAARGTAASSPGCVQQKTAVFTVGQSPDQSWA